MCASTIICCAQDETNRYFTWHISNDTIVIAGNIIPGSKVEIGNQRINIIRTPGKDIGEDISLFKLSQVEKPMRINNGVTMIEEGAFAGFSITSVSIPNTAMVGKKAFILCHNLKNVYASWDSPPLVDVNYFGDGKRKVDNLYIPKGKKKLYIRRGWEKCFKNIIEIE